MGDSSSEEGEQRSAPARNPLHEGESRYLVRCCALCLVRPRHPPVGGAASNAIIRRKRVRQPQFAQRRRRLRGALRSVRMSGRGYGHCTEPSSVTVSNQHVVSSQERGQAQAKGPTRIGEGTAPTRRNVAAAAAAPARSLGTSSTRVMNAGAVPTSATTTDTRRITIARKDVRAAHYRVPRVPNSPRPCMRACVCTCGRRVLLAVVAAA
jgi:hypothetical protein